jgi:hypothetical protein
LKKVFARFTLFAMLCSSLALWAGPKRYDVSFGKTVQAGSATIDAGKYQLENNDGSIVLYQGKKEVAKVPVRSEDVAAKAEGTSVSIQGEKLLWIQLEGTKKKLVVQNGPGGNNAGE